MEEAGAAAEEVAAAAQKTEVAVLHGAGLLVAIAEAVLRRVREVINGDEEAAHHKAVEDAVTISNEDADEGRQEVLQDPLGEAHHLPQGRLSCNQCRLRLALPLMSKPLVRICSNKHKMHASDLLFTQALKDPASDKLATRSP